MRLSNRAGTAGRWLMSFASTMLAAALLAVGQAPQAQENHAKSILKAMSDYLGSQKTIELTFDSDIEVIHHNWKKSSSATPVRHC